MGVKQLADPLKLGDWLLPRLNFHLVEGVMGSGHRCRDRSDVVLRRVARADGALARRAPRRPLFTKREFSRLVGGLRPKV
jgi:hypothetical protein